MEYENIRHVASFMTTLSEEKYVNELLDSGWTLLKVVQFSNEYDSYGRYILGADDETFKNNNFDLIQKREKRSFTDEYGF